MRVLHNPYTGLEMTDTEKLLFEELNSVDDLGDEKNFEDMSEYEWMSMKDKYKEDE